MSRSKGSDFVYQEKLGEGTYGQVYKAKRKEDGQLYVIKKVNISELSKKEQLAAINEVKLLANMDNAHVVQYFDSFIDDGALHIVMEYCDKGDLSHMMKRTKDRGKFVPEPRIWSIFCQILLGLHYLHSQRVLHRDMKTANVFLTKSKHLHNKESRLVVKIGDLGVAKLLGTTNGFADTVVGTPYYLSPELVQDMPYNGKSDMWALGIILYELTTCHRPFEANNQCALILKIIRGEFQPIPPERASKDLIDFTNQLLNLDPKIRPSAKKLLSHPRIQYEFRVLGFDLPPDIQPTNLSDMPRGSGLADSDSASRQYRYGAAEGTQQLVSPSRQSRIVSARLENLAQPAKKIVPAADAASFARSDRPLASVIPPPKDKVRGGRVRGGGARMVSQRARQRPISNTPPSSSGINIRQHDNARDSSYMSNWQGSRRKSQQDNDDDDTRQDRPLGGEAKRLSSQSSSSSNRPTIHDLLAKHDQEEENEENVVEPISTNSIADNNEDGGGGGDDMIAEAKQSQRYDNEDDVKLDTPRSVKEDDDVVLTQTMNRTFRQEGGNNLEGGEGVYQAEMATSSHSKSGRMEVIGWAAAARNQSRKFESTHQEEFYQEDDQEEEEDDNQEVVEEEEGNEEGYEEEAWEQDSDDDIEDRSHVAPHRFSVDPEQTLQNLASTSRSLCIQLLGSEDVLEDLCDHFREAQQQNTLVSDQELFAKVKSLCGNDQLEAQQVAQAVQRYMAAKIGLTTQLRAEEKEEGVRGDGREGDQGLNFNGTNTGISYDVMDDEVFTEDSVSYEFNNKMSF